MEQKFKLSLPELKKILKDNKLHGQSLNKPEIAEVLINAGILRHEDIYCEDRTERDPKYERLHMLRCNPKKVKITDLETGNIQLFPSIYRAHKTTKHCMSTLLKYNGKVWKGRYEIEYI